MNIINTTRIPDALVREVIRFVRPTGVGNFDVMLKNSDCLAGRAYVYGSGVRAKGRSRHTPFVSLRVPTRPPVPFLKWPNGVRTVIRPKAFPRIMRPYPYGHLKGKKYVLADMAEALVYLMAHELRHIWQGGYPHLKRRRGMAWGARGRFSEIDTESFAINRLRAWRRRDDSTAPELSAEAKMACHKTALGIIRDLDADEAAKLDAQAKLDAEIEAARKREAALAEIAKESARLDANAKRWDAKLRRATNAIKKIARRRKALARRVAKLNP